MTTHPPDAGDQPRKKSRALVWILGGFGGCLVLVIVCVIGLGLVVRSQFRQNPAATAARLLRMTNSNVELVSVDEAKQEITIRDKKTGKVYTVSLEDAEKGKFVIKEDGKTTVIDGGESR